MNASADTLPWTADRANRALPLVRRIAADIVTHYAEWQRLVLAFELANVQGSGAQPDPEAERLAREVQRVASQIEGFVQELTEIGVEVKELETGLLDFPGELDGRPVYFCWRHGERSVAHWHELDAGFGGRQPIP